MAYPSLEELLVVDNIYISYFLKALDFGLLDKCMVCMHMSTPFPTVSKIPGGGGGGGEDRVCMCRCDKEVAVSVCKR